jgi:hypothetical protein
VRVAVSFPGGYEIGDDPHSAPLAQIVRQSLAQVGYDVVDVMYDDFADDDRRNAGIRRDVAAATGTATEILFVGKSFGSKALALLADELPEGSSARFVWLTPVWKWDDAWEAAMRSRAPALYVVGGADPYHLADRQAALPGKSVLIDGVDHGLEDPNDVLRTLDSWRVAAEAIMDFGRR